MLINKKILAGIFLSLVPAAAQNCNLLVPAAPLTATGLAIPWQLSTTTGSPTPCSVTSFGGSVYVEATIFDTAKNTFSAYFPLVVNAPANTAASPNPATVTAAMAAGVGTAGYVGGAAIAPVTPTLTATSVVGIWIGGNNGITTLVGTTTNGVSSLTSGNCVNGASATDLFGEYAYCNAVAFWTAVNAALAKKAITLPPLGTTMMGEPCPTVRSFSLVDQDQSDNVLSSQLLIETVTLTNGLVTNVLGLQVAQDTVSNRGNLNVVTNIINGSDERLISGNVLAAVGCTPFLVPNLADLGSNTVAPGPMVTTQALSELMASVYQTAPIALVPALDPMVVTTTNGAAAANMNKLNLYRAGVNQTPVTALTQADTVAYCQQMTAAAPQFLATHYNLLNAAPSLVPAVGNTLVNFLAARFVASFANLNCATLSPGLKQPLTIVTNLDNVAVGTNLLTLFPNAAGPAAPALPAGALNGNNVQGPAGAAAAGGAAGAPGAAGAAGDGSPAAAGAAGGAAGTPNNNNGPGGMNAVGAASNSNSLPMSTVLAAGGALVGGLVLLFVALFAFGVITCRRSAPTSRV